MDIVTIILRILHIFGGVFWVGAAWLVTFFVSPAAQSLGADGGKFMTTLMSRYRLPLYISVSAVITLVAGFILYYTRFISLGLASTSSGMVFGLGGILGLVGGVIGGAVVGTTTTKLAALGGEIGRSGKPPTADQAAQLTALQSRLQTASLWNAIIVTLALLAMAVARYV
jgi:hypothetical protein